MKKLIVVAAAIPLILGAAPAAMGAPTPTAGVAYAYGYGGAYAGLPGATDMFMAGISLGTAVGRHGASGMALDGKCHFDIDESLATSGTLTGGCSGGASITDCTMTWVRTGLQGHAYGRCTVMGSRAAMAIEVVIQPTSTRPMTTFNWYATIAPAGETAI